MTRTTGTSKIDTAKLCFNENLKNFGDAQAQPEKFNLYQGLYNLASAVEEMQAEIRRLRAAIDNK